jgi:hypothetical protein
MRAMCWFLLVQTYFAGNWGSTSLPGKKYKRINAMAPTSMSS